MVKNMETAMLEVVVVIAVSEDGVVTASVQEECRLVQKRQHDEWLRVIREDSKLWTLKKVKTYVPIPVQYEEQA